MEMTTIEAGTYEGYVWKSDQKEPEVYDNKTISAWELDANKNPFIIEAQLYDKKSKVSYSVKYVDGTYIINKYTKDDLKDYDFTVHKYYPNRLSVKSGDRCENVMLKFEQYWKPEDDHFCGDENNCMQVLNPYCLVFIGFERKEESK